MDESVLPATLRHDSLHLETRLAGRQQALAGHRKRTRPLRSPPALGQTLHHVSPATPLQLQQTAPVHRPNQKVRPPRQIPQRIPEHEYLQLVTVVAGPMPSSSRRSRPERVGYRLPTPSAKYYGVTGKAGLVLLGRSARLT